ncbi:hypothetical protein [Bacillus sp. JCM 19041]|uniref:hypothetical protein n=1 Tax=Bacillus sp. JCM 19041 TaxID=1460637 RepID=UPI000ABB82F3
MKSKKKVLLLYIVISVLWIVGTDQLLSSWEPELYTLFQKLKGIVFVAATGIFIYFLMTKSEKIQALQEEKEKVGTLINSMVDFVNFKDGEGRWIQANEFA